MFDFTTIYSCCVVIMLCSDGLSLYVAALCGTLAEKLDACLEAKPVGPASDIPLGSK